MVHKVIGIYLMQLGGTLGILGILGILWYTERIYQRGISNIPKYTIEIPKDLISKLG